MGNFGAFLGGAADAMVQQRQLGQQDRALNIQQQQVNQQGLNFQWQIANQAIGDTLSTIGNVVKNIAASPNVGTGMPAYANAIKSVESGGDYKQIGPVTKTGDRAYGAYQVMGANIPDWTKEVTGTAMTPQQFLDNPQVQDAVFQAKFGQSLQQYGNADDAASVWFTGRPYAQGKNQSDATATTPGITGAEYVQKFSESLASQPQNAMRAAVAPLMQDIVDIAGRMGIDPSRYTNQVNAMITSTPTGVDAAVADGKNAAVKMISQYQGLVNSGVAAPTAAITAGIKGPLDPQQILQAEGSMRDQYLAQSKDFIDIRNAYDQVTQANALDTRAGEIGFMYGIIRMFNPSAGVKEGVATTLGESPDVPSRIINVYNQLINGVDMTQAQRQEFMDIATSIYKGTQKLQNQLSSQYTQIAKTSGLDPSHVVVDLTAPAAAASNGAKPGPSFGTSPSPNGQGVTYAPPPDEEGAAFQGVNDKGLAIFKRPNGSFFGVPVNGGR